MNSFLKSGIVNKFIIYKKVKSMSEEQVESSEHVDENIFSFKDSRTGFDPFLSYQGDKKEKPEEYVIVMDNGKILLSFPIFRFIQSCNHEL